MVFFHAFIAFWRAKTPRNQYGTLATQATLATGSVIFFLYCSLLYYFTSQYFVVLLVVSLLRVCFGSVFDLCEQIYVILIRLKMHFFFTTGHG